MACVLLWSSAVSVQDSQACRKMDVTKERISSVLELREILLSLQTGFNLVNAAVACAILESISGLEPSSVIIEPRYLKLVTVSSFCPFILIFVLMPQCLIANILQNPFREREKEEERERFLIAKMYNIHREREKERERGLYNFNCEDVQYPLKERDVMLNCEGQYNFY